MKKKLLFVGPVLTASGYGVHARQLLKALVDDARYLIKIESIRWGETAFLNDESLDWIRALDGFSGEPDICVQVTIPNEFKRRAPLTVGVTAGIEVDRVSPQWLLKCNQEVDLVVVPSEHSAKAFGVQYTSNTGQQLRLEKPIAVVPEGVDTYMFARIADGLRHEVSDVLTEAGVPKKNFVFVGLGLDKPDGRDRKNVTKLIEWFCKGFAGRDDVGLVLKTNVVNSSVVDFEVTKKRIDDIKRSTGCGDLPKIFLVHGRLDEWQFNDIYNDSRVLAAVSLTHGEGFGLPLIEAAACGLPIIATDWSGHLDFLTKDGKKLFVPVAYDLAQIPVECVWEGVMEAGSSWANPREQDTVAKMKKMVVSSDTPRKWAQELAEHVAGRYDSKRTGKEFVELVANADGQLGAMSPRSRDELVSAMRHQVRAKGKSLIYTMPMSAGDVFLSTAVVKALRDKHPGHRVYFATSLQYFGILQGSPLVDELIEWLPWMQDISAIEDVFDEVYTPNLAVQMTHSNWVHKGNGRHLLDEFAVQCGLDPHDLTLPQMADSDFWHPEKLDDGKIDILTKEWVAVHTGGQKSARQWHRWKELVTNIRDAGLSVMQVGAPDDLDAGPVDYDGRGRDFKDLPKMLDVCRALVCIDSLPMHVADAYHVETVSLFGSSYPQTTGPRDYPGRSRMPVMLEATDRKGCERACYKDVCKVDSSDPCINTIPPQRVWDALGETLGFGLVSTNPGEESLSDVKREPLRRNRDGKEWPAYKEHRPKISGYTHILNPLRHGYPFFESITSMLGFCDEVVVVDGGSDDGSVERLKALAEPALKIIVNPWDYEEPGMDGMQKAFGRAMCSQTSEFLWQQDADEVVHPRDYEKIRAMCRRFPADVDVLHLPVIELWGDAKTCRTDRHSWKWRLSRNNFRVTHGINARARLMDKKTGRFYAQKGLSDGCEYIDIVSGEHLPHRGFYNDDLERLRREDPAEYGKKMNELFKLLPSVWHYSWADLPRKIRNFKDFWDGQWQVLYQSSAEPRFPDVVSDDDVGRKAEELKRRGGEHGPAATFELDLEPPNVVV